MISAILLAVSVGLLALGAYRWVTLNNGYFAKRKMAHVAPTFLLGSTGGFYLKQHRINEFVRGLYNKFPNEKLFGIFDLREPLIVLRDPQLIAQLAVKDFDHFENHRFLIDSVDDDVLGNALLLLRGQKWRHMRATLSPAFTGRKMRSMFELVNRCCADTSAGLAAMLTEGEGVDHNKPVVLEMKEVFARYANDVIVSTAFGYHVNSFADPQNAFLANANRMIGSLSSVRAVLMVIGGRICPWLVRWLGIQMMDADVKTFFRNVVMDTFRERQEKQVYRPDMIDMLAHLKRGTNVIRSDERKAAEEMSAKCECTTTETAPDGFATASEATVDGGVADNAWTDNEMIAQCFLFFLAGFDTVSSVLSFLAYELAINPDVQQQLYAECRAVRQELMAANGDTTSTTISYDRLQRMSYMDQVVCEVLRMWPPAMLTDRYCGKPYAYDDGELQFAVDKGTSVWIPIAGLHHDPKYFHNPESFMPERFSDENRHSIVSGSYLPFGVGPRNCIASRFALMEVKAIVYHLMLEFSFEPTINTQIPIRLAKATGGMETEHGIHLELKRRQHEMRH